VSDTGRAPRQVSAAVEVAGLTKRYGGRTAVDNVTFTVPAGEVFGFLGPNGAGKTTTVRMLSGLVTPTSGSAAVAGIPVTEDTGGRVRERISVLPEAAGLYLKLSVGENLEYFARLHGVGNRAARIARSLDAVGLADRAGDLCGSLSKGLRQRAALARTLLNDPDVMFLDEPTSGLDPAAAHGVLGLIASLRDRGITVFLTTHRLEEAERLCDRVAVMNTRLHVIGRPQELRRTLFSRSLVVATAAALPDPETVFGNLPPVLAWHEQTPSRHESQPPGTRYRLTVTDPTVAAPAVTRALVAADADVLQVTEESASLEDVYLQLVNDGKDGAAAA
jgi:ABC-2 type transport system ATP-binding protein